MHVTEGNRGHLSHLKKAQKSLRGKLLHIKRGQVQSKKD